MTEQLEIRITAAHLTNFHAGDVVQLARTTAEAVASGGRKPDFQNAARLLARDEAEWLKGEVPQALRDEYERERALWQGEAARRQAVDEARSARAGGGPEAIVAKLRENLANAEARRDAAETVVEARKIEVDIAALQHHIAVELRKLQPAAQAGGPAVPVVETPPPTIPVSPGGPILNNR